MRKIFAVISGGLAMAVAAGLIVFALSPAIKAASPLTFEALKGEIPMGKAVRLEVRLSGAGVAPGLVTVTSSRIDMGPDGMPTMAAPLRQVESKIPGVLAFEADLVMAGRWALSLTAKVEGQSEPVKGMVIFTVVEKRSEAMPSAKSSSEERRILYYRHPMGLPDTSTAPKKDSMGMDYIPVYADEVLGPTGTIRITPEKVQKAGVRTEPVTRRDLSRTVRAVGTIVPDESRLAVVAVKFGGFVEELLVPTAGVEVRAGQPIARVWIESTEILQKQADFLTALRGGASRGGDIASTERNLRLFGIPNQAIDQIRRSGEAVRSVVLNAPANGTVLDKPAVVGMRFEAGDALFRMADLSTVWAMVQVSERDLALVRPGQGATITLKAYPSEPVEGRVALVYPELDMATRTARVRIELPNPDGLLRGGLYAEAAIRASVGSEPVVALPESAIIDNGSRRVAFVSNGDGTFEPRNLTLGSRGNGYVEVREGLAEGERIVTTGNFLIDAESNLRTALTAFTPPEMAQ
jgi:membrane fusion protein, copper/silver efflux system